METEKTKEETQQEQKAEETEELKNSQTKKAEKKTARKKRLLIYHRIIFTVLILGAVTLIAIFLFGVGVKHNDGPVGYWTITKASSGDVSMTAKDAEAMGLSRIGSFKLNKSGDCVITYLGKEFEGTWKKSDSGKIVIDYGEEGRLVAEINTKTGIMTAEDGVSMVYTLEK